jgi:hypothetical protein
LDLAKDRERNRTETAKAARALRERQEAQLAEDAYAKKKKQEAADAEYKKVRFCSSLLFCRFFSHLSFSLIPFRRNSWIRSSANAKPKLVKMPPNIDHPSVASLSTSNDVHSHSLPQSLQFQFLTIRFQITQNLSILICFNDESSNICFISK